MQIVRQIEIFTQSYPNNRYIVTSRIVGYKDAPLAADYQAYTLADFSDEQIRTFTKKWCPAYERWVNQVNDNQALQEAATNEAGKLFQATRLNEGVKRLAVNPLLLTILALIQRQGIDLPSHRVELFDLCITTLLETWIKAKGPMGVTQFSKNDIIKILRPLAFWMHEHPAVGAIPEDQLIEQIVRQLLDRKVTRTEDEAQQVAEQFLQTVREKTGILVERGRHRYGFLHLTFEEYFAAWELVIRKRVRDDFVKQHLHDSRWRVVILLTVGIIGILQSDEDGVTELVEETILNANSLFEKWLYRDLLLAGVCLADDVGMSITLEESIIEKIIYIYLTSPFNSIRDSFSTILNVWRGTPIARKATNLILDLIEQNKRWRDENSLSLNAVSSFTASLRLQKAVSLFYQSLLQQVQESADRTKQVYIIIALNYVTDVAGKIKFVIKALSDPNASVRSIAVRALGQLDNDQPQVIEALLKALSDAESEVQSAAATALGQLGNDQPQVIEALLKALSNVGWSVQNAAITALGRLGNDQPQVIEALLKTLSDAESGMQSITAKALGQLSKDQPQVVEALLKALSNAESEVRSAASTALSQLGNGQPQVIEALLKALSDPEWSVRSATATALGRLGNDQPQVIEALLKALSDPRSSVRSTAIKALSQLSKDQSQVIEALLKALADSEWNVRSAAARALGELGNDQPQLVEALLKTILDVDSDVRNSAIRALSQLGTDRPQVVEALLKALSENGISTLPAIMTALSKSPINLNIDSRIDEILLDYEVVSKKQINVDDSINELLNSLQQIVGGI